MLVSKVSLNKSHTRKQAFTAVPSNAMASSSNLLSNLYKGLKNGSVSKTDLTAFVLTSISGACYLVGGTGLLYDFASEKRHKTPTLAQKPLTPTNAKTFSEFIKEKPQTKFGNTKNNDKKKTEGARTIVPQTNFAKVGMKFARVAVALAGVAGVFNGIALDLPLLALGEGITSLSAPIIETPVGTGIFGFGLALINLARVLDKDPEFKINRDKFNASSISNKAGMLTGNIKHTLYNLGNSTKTIFKNFAGLFSSKSKESASFFKNEMFSIKPTSIALQEEITKEGKVLLKKAPINNPYLMHFAAFGLTVSSLSLMISNMLKKPKAERASLRGYGISNGIDNIALSKWGVETFIGSNTVSGKASGGAFALAGASLLSGQAGIDRNWGRGLMWNGVGIILLGFSAQTGAKVLHAIKSPKIAPILVREWKILSKNKFLDSQMIKNISEKLDSIFTKNADYNKNSDEVELKIKTKLSEIKGLQGLKIKKISDSFFSVEKKAKDLSHIG